MSNSDIRAWYLAQVAGIAELNAQWILESVPLPERARRAWSIRHYARLQARAMMEDPSEVEMLRRRDLAKYENPDGPTFEQLETEARTQGIEGDEIFEHMIRQSMETDRATNRRFHTGGEH